MTKPQARRSAEGGETLSSLGPSRIVTYRIPTALYQRIEAIARATFQPVPVVLRAAAFEYTRRHGSRRKPEGTSGLHLSWPEPAPATEAAENSDNSLTPEELTES